MHILPQGGLKICSKAESLKNDTVGLFPCAIKKKKRTVFSARSFFKAPPDILIGETAAPSYSEPFRCLNIKLLPLNPLRGLTVVKHMMFLTASPRFSASRSPLMLPNQYVRLLQRGSVFNCSNCSCSRCQRFQDTVGRIKFFDKKVACLFENRNGLVIFLSCQ